MPLLIERMHNGSMLEQTIIRRITPIDNTHRTLQTITFSKCRITSCQKESDLFAFSFSYIQVENAFYRYDPETGYLTGVIAHAFNAATLKSIRTR